MNETRETLEFRMAWQIYTLLYAKARKKDPPAIANDAWEATDAFLRRAAQRAARVPKPVTAAIPQLRRQITNGR
jgi:hypothetical protein